MSRDRKHMEELEERLQGKRGKTEALSNILNNLNIAYTYNIT